MKIRIEERSGFCYGVVKVVEMADEILDRGESLFSLGQIVHNEEEVKRLEKKGMRTITREDLPSLHDCRLLIRAHGEPPLTYEIAAKNRIEIIDGTCPIVRKIQNGIRAKALEKDALMVIFGKVDHPEVEGLYGQSPVNTIVIRTPQEVRALPSSPNLHLYSQTTMDTAEYLRIKEILIQKQENEGGKLTVHNTLCGHVSHRKPGLQKFARENELIIFVGGKHSSNGKVLFQACRDINPNSHYIGEPDELQDSWFEGVNTIGIAGATSTPLWQIEKVSRQIQEKYRKN